MSYFETDELLLLEHLTYLHRIPPFVSILHCKNMTVGEVLSQIDTEQLIDEMNYGSYIVGRDWRNLIAAMKKNQSILDVQIIETHIDEAQGGGGGISIVMLSEEKGEAIVAFRGTAPAEWADDFAGANVVATAQQENALAWYESVYEKLNLNRYYVTVIGHSKGGNKAKFIAILAPTVDRCVAFDGQGFSDKFFRVYHDRIVDRQEIIVNHNVDYDYVNILLNDVGKRIFYKGYDYGRGGFVESHCPNTFFEFYEEGCYRMEVQEFGQSPEMQEVDRFLNSYLRTIPSDSETTEATVLIGNLVERAFNLKRRGESTSEYMEFICEMIADETYSDNVAFLLAYYIKYEKKHPGFTENITRVMSYFDMDGLVKYMRMLEKLLEFPGLGPIIGAANFFSGHLPDKVFHSIQDSLKERYDVDLTREQIEGMLSIIRHLRKSLKEIQIKDDGEDIKIC